MATVRSAGNRSTERALRARLVREGVRGWRLNARDVLGCPDFVFDEKRLAVFVDGCFWHGCPVHGTIPKHNRDWWIEKLENNRIRDTRKDRALGDLGWTTVHIWEHENVEIAAERIESLWRSRTGR